MNPKSCISMGFTQFELSKLTLKNLNKFTISPTAKLVLLALVDKYPKIFPSQQFIATELGISLASVKRAISELSRLALIVYETKHVNNYKFTSAFFNTLQTDSKFFEPNKLTPDQAQIELSDGVKLSPKQTNHEINKKVFQNFQKPEGEQKIIEFHSKPTYRHYPQSMQNQGITYKKYVPEKIKEGSPLDFDKAQALDYLNNLPAFLQNSFFAVELRKKYGPGRQGLLL